jgi:hypothetical protein
MIVTFVAGAAALGLLLKYRSAILAKFKGEVSVVSVVAAKGTAFARLAEQEGKVVALKAANAAKAAEAKAIHAGLDELDEFDMLIG